MLRFEANNHLAFHNVVERISVWNKISYHVANGNYISRQEYVLPSSVITHTYIQELGNSHDNNGNNDNNHNMATMSHNGAPIDQIFDHSDSIETIRSDFLC